MEYLPQPRRYQPDSNDLNAMTALAQAAWQRHGRNGTNFHIGDLYWQLRYADFERDLWLWENGRGGLAGFAMLSLDEKLLAMQLHPRYDGSTLEERILDWAEELAPRIGKPTQALTAFVVQGMESVIDRLVRRGYVLRSGYYNHHLRKLDRPVEAPAVPEGYMVRHLRGAEEVARRVEGHRGGWQSTLLTEESYRRMMQMPGYRMDLDIVVEAPDGSFAATTNCWLDEQNRVGIFEPVSTHPEHRRKGLASAMMFYGMNRLRELSATDAVVCSISHNPGATRLYESCGMEVIGRQFSYDYGGNVAEAKTDTL